MKSHALADCYPKMTGKPLTQLADSIKKIGQKSPIYTDSGGLILDGRSRFAACTIAGVKPWIEEYDGPNDTASLVAFVQAANEYRRHLTPQQLAASAVNLIKASKVPGGTFQRLTQQTAAAMTGASLRSIKRVANVNKHAVPEVKLALERNEVALADADATARQPKEKQRAALKAVQSGRAKTLSEAIGDDDSFDPEKIEAAPRRPEQKAKNGKPVVTVKQRKDCEATLGKLSRELSKIGIYDEFIVPLSQIAERLKQL
jgi:ParB-like chromosome segregation protein Spo0J